MVAFRYRLTTSQKDDLAAVCELGKEGLVEIADAIEAAKFTIRRSQLEKVIEGVAGAKQGTILARILFGVAGTFRRSFVSADEAIDGLTRSLGDAPASDPRFKNWGDCVPAIKRLLTTKSLALAAKALDISYDFERVCIAARILTSVRPVFDEHRQEVVGSTIVQTLRLEFVGADGDRSGISVAMDMDDIQRLKEECERAVNKANAARTRIEKDCAIEAIIPGEE